MTPIAPATVRLRFYDRVRHICSVQSLTLATNIEHHPDTCDDAAI